MSTKAATPDPVEIAGRYEVVKRLGAGAFGTVYKAKDKVLGRMLAIKTIRLEGLAASGASLEELMDRFKREAQISAQLRHPNIVTIYDVGEADGMSYLAMEFIDGVGLDRVIAAAGRMPIERAALIAAQVADALSFAHQHNVVHRDIKPANIMIEAGDRVKVTDFGIAKVTDSGEHLTMTGSLLGTPSYMSPEQAKGGKLDGRSDLFAVGAILYEMLAGQKAFRGDSITGLIFKIITEEPQLITDLDPSLPADLVKVVHKALNKAPEQRYQSGREMAEDLLAYTRAGGTPTLRQGDIDTMRGGHRGDAPTMAGITPTISEAPTHNRAGQATELARPAAPAPVSQEPTQLSRSGSVPAPVVDPTHHMAGGSRPPTVAAPAPPAPAPQPVAPPPPTPGAPTRTSAGGMPPVRSARIAQPEKSKAGLVVGLVAAFVLVLLAGAGGGLYYFVLRKPATPPTTLVAENPTTTLVAVPSAAPSAAPTSEIPATLAASTAPTPGPVASVAPTPGASVAPHTPPPVTQPANQGGTRVADGGTPPNTGGVVTAPGNRGASDLSVLDVEPPELNGRDTGAAVADTYRNRGGFGNQNNSTFGASGRLRARGKVPRDLTMPERRAAIVLLNLMGLEAVHHRQSGRYGTLTEVLPAHAGAPNQIDRAGYRFNLKVEADGFAITATSANGRALIADDSGFVRFADE